MISLSFYTLVGTENRISRELVDRAPRTNYLPKNFQFFTGASWFSYLQLSCWTFSQKLPLTLNFFIVPTVTSKQKTGFSNLFGFSTISCPKNSQIFMTHRELIFVTNCLTDSTLNEIFCQVQNFEFLDYQQKVEVLMKCSFLWEYLSLSFNAFWILF